MKTRFFAQRFLIIIASSLSFATAVAGGFQLWEQDASGMGDYHAGAAAEADTAGTEFYNPAGMVNLKQFELSLGAAYIPLEMDFLGVVPASDMGLTPFSATSETKNYVPNFHMVWPFLNRFALGFGVTVPFGLSTEYSLDNPIAVAATKTQLKTVNLNPNLAIALSKYLSVGVGFDALYGEATYNSGVNAFGPPVFPLENQLSSWGYGWNGGILINATPHTRLGLSYRSQIGLNGVGTSKWLQPDAPSMNPLTAQINLPATTTLSFYTDINEKLAFLFSAFYTQWNIFNNLILNGVDVGVLGPSTILTVHENYVNTWNLALGLHYWLVHNVMLKLGFGYDQTPTQDGYRDVRLPDSSRYALAVGLHWDIIQIFSVDGGWIHFFTHAANVNNINSTDDPILGPMTAATGIATASVDVVGIQLSVKI